MSAANNKICTDVLMILHSSLLSEMPNSSVVFRPTLTDSLDLSADNALLSISDNLVNLSLTGVSSFLQAVFREHRLEKGEKG
jgi:hypothetical protein